MWNYHPSLPMKNMQMVEDITDIHANMLVWSCLGSGAIGLPYMDKEANEEIPPRLRLYGFMNDREFCAECKKRGVRVFSVLWKAQLWEFGAEFNEEESELLSLNILRGASENHGYVGMSELSTNRYPKLFDPMEKYFPEGLLDYQGNKVGDFLEEFKAVSLEGRNILSSWLMAPGHDHKCYSACGNKDSYLAYMKRDVEMMIDAGAGGLHIDEYDTQKHVVHNAGCFCPECMEKFRRYLAKNRIALPEDAGEVTGFDYRAYLLKKGYKDDDLIAANGNERWKVPLFREFVDMQMESIEWVVRELSGHARAYAKKKGDEDFKVTANLFQCYPYGWKCKKYLDILAGEKSDIRLRQDGWYQFAFGWLNGKECCFVEDPNEYVRDMVTDIKNGINDRLILFLMEPLAHGFHVAFPYGSWLQNQVKDAFWPDLRVLKKLGAWMDEKEAVFPKKPVAKIGVVYDTASALQNLWTEPAVGKSGTYNKVEKMDLTGVAELGSQGSFASDGDFGTFFDLLQRLSEEKILYNVIYESPDEPLDAKRLTAYQKVIVPDAFCMEEEMVRELNAYGERGGEVIAFARKAPGLVCAAEYTQEQQEELVSLLAGEEQEIRALTKGDYGIAWHDTGRGRALHVVNYQYNERTHRIDALPELEFELDRAYSEIKLHCFPENPELLACLDGRRVKLQSAGIYTIVEFCE